MKMKQIVRKFCFLQCWFLCVISASSFSVADENAIPETLQQFEQQLRHISDGTKDGVVVVAALHSPDESKTASECFEKIISPERSQLPARLGMGVVIDKNDGKLSILTSIQLVEPVILVSGQPRLFKISVKFHTNEIAEATLIASDPRSELAVLQVEIESLQTKTQSLEPVKLQHDYNPVQGSVFVAIGDAWEMARDGQAGLSAAIVSNTGRSSNRDSELSLAERTLHELGTLLSLDLPIRFSTPGTPLFNLNGEFAGLVHRQSLFSEDKITVCDAIPMTRDFRRVLRELSAGYEVEYGFLGISTETSSSEAIQKIGLSAPQYTAAMIVRVPENSPAAKAGLEREDLILRVNDEKIETNGDLIREVNFLEPNHKVELILYREGEGTFSVSMKLGKWPLYDDSLLVTSKNRYEPWRGLQVDYPTARRRFLRDRFLTVFPKGVVVTSVEKDSVIDHLGLQVGQFIVKVNGQNVSTPREFHKAVSGQHDEVKFTLEDEEEVLVPETLN